MVAEKVLNFFKIIFESFYKNIFFPTLEQHGIANVIHMGDAFDSRKSIDYQSLEWTKRVVLDPLSKYNVHMLVGNHDAYYKNTNNVKFSISSTSKITLISKLIVIQK